MAHPSRCASREIQFHDDEAHAHVCQGNASIRKLGRSFTLTAILLIGAGSALGADWPTYRHDRSRSGITASTLTMPLAESWVYRPLHKPQSAWGEPNPRPVGGWHGLTERRRVHFDDALHVVIADGALYFGSSADGSVVSLDTQNGQQRWRKLTEGPVRLAPTIWQGNIYVGSDDGYVYCLSGKEGSERWRFRAAPSDRKVLGSSKMISLWPVRTGVLVDDDTAYFGAGVFPAEGVYMYAVDAADGKLIWCNDSGGAAPQSRISPQGYLLASNDRIFAPLGRVSPAAFDRNDGRLLYESYTEHIIGGTNAMLADDKLFTGTEQMIGYDQASHRDQSSWFWSHQLVVSPDVFYAATGKELFAVRRATYGNASLRRKRLLDQQRDLSSQVQRAKSGPEARRKQLQAQLDKINVQITDAEADMAKGELWRTACDCEESLVLAGNLLVAGGENRVVAFDSASGQQVWTADIDGKARGLAIANGQLFVSSDSGSVYCFGPKRLAHGLVQQGVDPAPFPQDDMTAVIQGVATRIVNTTDIDRGYCLVIGCGSGRLAYELARQTHLQICCVESDIEKVRAARAALDAAGLYGSRVTIEHCEQSRLPFSDYFANLIVSEEALTSGRVPTGADEVFRMLKPLGGTVCIGLSGVAGDSTLSRNATALQQWWAAAGIEGGTIADDGDSVWLDFRRGTLPGAGSWTHQYAEPGNSTCSDDQLVRGPLGVLWFGNPGPGQMAERHRRAAAPLAVNGRLFVLGEGAADRIGAGQNTVMAFDSYNGLKLWERKIRGALRVSVTHDAGNSAANQDSIFLAVGDRCVQLDAATGETKHTYELPQATDKAPRSWGYIAVVDGVLYGSRTTKGRTADCVFAFDVKSGGPLWNYTVDGIAQGAVAISQGRLHLAASKVTKEQREQALSPQVKEVHKLSEPQRAAVLKKLEEATVYNVITLDAYTGEKLWEKPVEVTGAVGGAYWCSLGAICKDNTLLLFGVFLDGHYWTQFLSGQFESRQVVALSAEDGDTMWRKPIGYRVRPLVVGDTLHAEPWAYELKTGEQQTRVHPVTGREEPWQFARPGHHCGAPAAAPHMLLFRSYNLGWYDLDNDYGTQHFGAQRAGCWINFIPANGLLMMPESSSGCMCPFPNTCTVVFKNREENRQWAYFSQPGEMTPVKQLALNIGAPGDRKDTAGALWLGYPRPRGSLVLQYQVGLSLLPGWTYFQHDPARLEIENTETPWVFRSGVSGLRQCTIPVTGPVDGKARYRVRLAFAELVHSAAGKRVFDIKIQGKVVAKNFDIYREAGGKNRAVITEFEGIDADEELVVEFVPAVAKPAQDQLPIVQGIEVDREEVLTLGMAAPSFLLNDEKPQQSGEVVIVNNKDVGFSGTLRVDAAEGFSITPAESPVKVGPGQRVTVSLQVAVGKDAEAGKFPVSVALHGADGTAESQQETVLEYLANRSRVVLTAIADAHVAHRSPSANYATNKGLLVDGGDRKMGDQHHAVAYLKFSTKLPGKPVAATLRLFNGDNPSVNSGQIRLVADPWQEKTVTYESRPEMGKVLGEIGRVAEHQVIDIPLDISLEGLDELSVAIDPTTCDGINYISREGGKPAELIVEYVK